MVPLSLLLLPLLMLIPCLVVAVDWDVDDDAPTIFLLFSPYEEEGKDAKEGSVVAVNAETNDTSVLSSMLLFVLKILGPAVDSGGNTENISPRADVFVFVFVVVVAVGARSVLNIATAARFP